MKTNLKMGIPSMIELTTVEESLALCKELGLSFFELNNNFPQYQPNALQPEELIRLSQKYGVSYTFHFDDNMSIADFNPYVADAYIRTTVETIELAKQLEIPVLNMHMPLGVYFTLPERKVYLLERYAEQYLRRAAQFRDACTRAIGDSGVKICVENWSGYAPWQIPVLDALLESSAFGLTFDVGHNLCKQGVDEPVILARREKLRHIHLHDVKDGTRDHQALGTGELDIGRYLKLAEESGTTVVVEAKTVAGLRESARWMEKNGVL
jgi:sugar phosphate isomerase/epimerase